MEMIMERLVRWLIKTFLPGWHLSKNPVRKPANVVSEEVTDASIGTFR